MPLTKAEGIPYSRGPGNLTSQSAPGAKAPCSYLYQNKTYPRAAHHGTSLETERERERERERILARPRARTTDRTRAVHGIAPAGGTVEVDWLVFNQAGSANCQLPHSRNSRRAVLAIRAATRQSSRPALNAAR